MKIPSPPLAFELFQIHVIYGLRERRKFKRFWENHFPAKEEDLKTNIYTFVLNKGRTENLFLILTKNSLFVYEMMK